MHSCVNEQGSVDSTRVTCVKWIPGSEHNFVSSHRSGNLYVWTTENHTSKVTSPPVYVSQKEILGAKIYTVRQKQKSALLACWTVGHGPINAFAFSPDAVHIAIASQDGFLRIYDYHKQAIYGRMRSYFGGLLCVCWSPDGKYTVTGGEDDLITVWSFEHKKVVARGEGHKSYVNAVAFDPYMTVLPSSNSPKELEKTEEMPPSSVQTQAEVSTGDGSEPESESRSAGIRRHLSVKSPASEEYTAYRLGSIGQDTQICLWDLSGDSLKIRRLIARGRSRMSRHSRPVSMVDTADTGTHSQPAKDLNPDTQQQPSSQEGQNSEEKAIDGDPSLVSNHFGHELNGAHLETNHLVSSDSDPLSELRVQLELDRRESSPSVSLSSTSSSASHKKAKKRKKDKNKEKTKDKPFKQQRNSLHKVMKFVGSGFSNSSPSHHNHGKRSVGTFESCNSDDIALKMHEVNLVEPLVAKKISLERLTALVFREDCILTACQEGFISTWARPNVCITSLESEEDANYPVADANVPTSNAGVSCYNNSAYYSNLDLPPKPSAYSGYLFQKKKLHKKIKLKKDITGSHHNIPSLES